MNKTNIVLIGMPGVGKSTVGVILAKVTGRHFLDTDLVIQAQTGKLLSEIIAERGAGGFIDLENDCIARVRTMNSVIATGGSAVYGRDAMAALSRDGVIVYLKASFDLLDSRLSDIRGRGVVSHPGQTLRDIYDERTPLYEKYADITVDCERADVEATVSNISDAVGGQMRSV